VGSTKIRKKLNKILFILKKSKYCSKEKRFLVASKRTNRLSPIYLDYPNTIQKWCDPTQLSLGAGLTIALEPDPPVDMANIQTDWIGPHLGRAAHNPPPFKLLSTPHPDE
jgi:hypothetical protein